MRDAPETILNLDIEMPNQTRYLGLIGNIAETIARETRRSRRGSRDARL